MPLGGGLRQAEGGPCAEQRGLIRFGDASPDLTYCAEALVAAFPDALIIQVVRDGRDSVAAMLGDQVAMSWFRPSVVNIETEFPNPFYGVEDEADRLAFPSLSAAGKCALRWRGAIDRRPAAPVAAGGPAQDAALRGHGARPRRGRGGAVRLHRGEGRRPGGPVRQAR